MRNTSQVALWAALTITIGAWPVAAAPKPPPPPDINIVSDLAVNGTSLGELKKRSSAYLVVVTNLGPSAAQAVSITGTLPGSGRFTRVMAEGCSHTARRFQCSLPSMQPQQSLSIRLVVKAATAKRLKVSARTDTLEETIKNNSSVITTKSRGLGRTGRF